MKKLIYVFVLSLLTFTACKNAEKKTEEVVEEVEKVVDNTVEEVVTVKTVSFPLESKSGSTAKGMVTFTEENKMVTMTASLMGLEEGMHAIHIHEKADCSSPDGKSTGGHWNPTFTDHGKWGAEDGKYHKGDIGNFSADAEGNGAISITTDEWCIGCEDETKNILGKAIIVHAGVDDYVTQPTGAAGGRVSCGGIIE
ncbi:superoxide dismutase family protein [Ascidiimonas sp. W6]|uniref:superoxide dismutase family protein n=1 Tax=Ascidiimonas meishanensis TaxID=3128903 RepID=UPI0030EC20E1